MTGEKIPTSPTLRFFVPIETKNPLNGSQFGGINWAKVRLRKKQRDWTRLAMLSALGASPAIKPVESVLFTRVAPRALDTDGLAASMKSIRDEVAAQLGVDDGPRAGVDWRYAQERGQPHEVGVIVEIRWRADAISRDFGREEGK